MLNLASFSYVLGVLLFLGGVYANVSDAPLLSVDAVPPTHQDIGSTTSFGLPATLLWIIVTTGLFAPGIVRYRSTKAIRVASRYPKLHAEANKSPYQSRRHDAVGKKSYHGQPYALTALSSVVAIDSARPQRGEARAVSADLLPKVNRC